MSWLKNFFFTLFLVKLNISNQSVSLSDFDVHVMDEQKIELLPDLLLDEIEVLS